MTGIRLLHVVTIPMSLTFLRGQGGLMHARGFDVHALSSPGDLLAAFGANEGVTVHAVPMSRRISAFGDLRAVAALYRAIRRIRPTLVHAHTPKGGLLGMIAAALAGVPVRVYHMRGLPMMSATGGRRLLLRQTERLSCALAHRVLCVSHSLRDAAVAEKVCPPDKIRVLGHGSGQGVDARTRFNPAGLSPGARVATRRRFGIPDDARVVGFVGRIVCDKGVRELLDAWRMLQAEYPDAHLLVVGPFERRDTVPTDVEFALRNGPRIHLTGLDWETPPLYAAMDVVALPTYREGFPNVALEAAAMELPIVATRIPGCVDAIDDGRTGTLVPARDACALAAALRGYLDDAGLRARHGRAGRARVLRDFRPLDLWNATYRQYISLLRTRVFTSARARHESATLTAPTARRRGKLRELLPANLPSPGPAGVQRGG